MCYGHDVSQQSQQREQVMRHGSSSSALNEILMQCSLACETTKNVQTLGSKTTWSYVRFSEQAPFIDGIFPIHRQSLSDEKDENQMKKLPKGSFRHQEVDLDDLRSSNELLWQSFPKMNVCNGLEEAWEIVSFGLPCSSVSQGSRCSEPVSRIIAHSSLPPPQKFPKGGIRRSLVIK